MCVLFIRIFIILLLLYSVRLAKRISPNSQNFMTPTIRKITAFLALQNCKISPTTTFQTAYNSQYTPTTGAAYNQLQLLQGIQRYGFGNWGQISQYMLLQKHKTQIQTHYNNIYLSDDTFTQVIAVNQKNKKVLSVRQKNMHMVCNKQFIKRGRKPKHKEEFNIALENARIFYNPNQIVGFMPLRGDFQIEHDNDAELLLAQMEFKDNQPQQETQMKLKLLNLYNNRLDQRIYRKNFVIQRKLLDIDCQLNFDKQKSKQQKQIYNMMKVFSRFNSAEQHQQLIKGINNERQIRKRIQQLNHYHKIGLKTFQQVDQYLIHKKNTQSIRIKKQKANDNYIWDKKHLNRRARIHHLSSIKKKHNNQIIKNTQQSICQKCNLSPLQYIAIRQTIQRQYSIQGCINKNQIEKNLKIDKNKLNRILEFLFDKRGVQKK